MPTRADRPAEPDRIRVTTEPRTMAGPRVGADAGNQQTLHREAYNNILRNGTHFLWPHQEDEISRIETTTSNEVRGSWQRFEVRTSANEEINMEQRRTELCQVRATFKNRNGWAKTGWIARPADRFQIPLTTLNRQPTANGEFITDAPTGVRLDFKLVKTSVTTDHRTRETTTQAWYEEV